MSRLALILPIYNYASHLETTLARLNAWKQRHSTTLIDIVFSDDGSTDATPSLLKTWISRNEGWHVVSHPQNTGKGGAIRRGFAYVRTLNPDLIVYCDCDLYYGLDIIFGALVPALITADIAIVDRSWRRDRMQASAIRKLASAVFNRSVAILTGVAFRDTQAGLKAFRAHPCEPIFNLLTIDGFTVDVEILSIALFYRLRVKQVPIKIGKEMGASTVSIFKSSIRMIIDLLKININWKTGRYEDPQLIASIENDVYDIRD